MGVNKIILVGNLGADPESNTTSTGNDVCNFRLATSESWKDKNTGQKQERTEWHRIVTFGKLAGICQQYLRKGKQVYIEGRIQTREWMDKDDNKRWTTEVVANQMQMLGQRQDGAASGPESSPAQNSQDNSETGTDEDLPF